MKYVIALFIATAIDHEVISQISETLFSTYKNHDLRLRQLELFGSLVGGNTNSNPDFTYNGDVSLNYSQFINRDKLQSDFYSGIQLYHSKSRNYSSTDDPLRLNYSASLFSANKSRHYSNNNFFYGYGWNFNYSLGYTKQEDFLNSNKVEKVSTHNVQIDVPVIIGIGRTYPVYSVHKSNWIYKTLKDAQSLNRETTTEDVEELAHLLDDNVYTRFFDLRYKRIQDLNRIDSVLSKQSILLNKDIKYYTTLFDMYLYSSGATRLRGSTLEGGVIGAFRYDQSKFETEDVVNFENRYYFRATVPAFFVEFQNFRPLNLYWQFDYGFRAEYGINSLVKDQNDIPYSIDNLFHLEGRVSIYFYPNTRSYFRAGLQLSYGNENFRDENLPYRYIYYEGYYLDSPFQYDIISLNYYRSFGFPLTRISNANYREDFFGILDLIHYYYINPQLRVRTALSLYYDDPNYFVNSKKLRTNFGISFSYAIF